MVVKWPFMSHNFLGFFVTKLLKTGNEKNNELYAVAVDPIKI